MNQLQKIAVIFDIRPGEGLVVSLLLLNSFFIGLTQTLTFTTATTKFLEAYGSQNLPYVYIGSAILVPLLGMILSFVGARMRYQWHLILATFSMLCILSGFWIWMDQTTGQKLVYLLLYILYFVQNLVLVNIQFWGLANHLLDVRQAKRLFGLIAAGEITARIITGFSIRSLISLFGSIHHLLLPAILSIIGSLILLLFFTHRQKLAQKPVYEKKVQNKDTQSYIDLFRNHYILLVFFVSIFTIISYYFVDLNYLSQARIYFPIENDLAVFIGYFSSISGLFTLISGLVITGPLITRFGVMAGLFALPVMTGFGIVLLSTIKLPWHQGTTIFLLASITKLLFTTFNDTTAKASSKILLKPLPPKERKRADMFRTIILEPALGGITGFALLRLPYNIFFYSNILLFLIAIWIMVIILLRQGYSNMLRRALGLRMLGGTDFSIEDAECRMVIERGLGSKHTGEVVYVLDLMETGGEKIEGTLIRLLNHPAWEVRRDVLRRIELGRMTGALKHVRVLMKEEERAQVRAACLRVLSSLGGGEYIQEVQELVNKGGTYEKEEAIMGQLKSGDIEGIIWGGEELLKLEKSKKIEERVQAARIIGNAEIENFYRPLERMMRDENKFVRKEAVKAALKLQNERLWKSIAEMINEVGIREGVMDGLASGGAGVIEVIEGSIGGENISKEDKKRLLHVCGVVKGNRAIEVLKKYIEDDDVEVVHQALLGLRKSRYKVSGEEANGIKRMIRKEVELSAWTMAILTDISQEEKAALLHRGLEQRLLVYRENIFTLLAFIYDTDLIMNAWNILLFDDISDERRVYALEIIDEMISLEFRPLVFPLLDSLTYLERLRKLKNIFPQKHLRPEHRYQEIILGSNALWGAWIKACALWILSCTNPDVYHYHLSRLSLNEEGKKIIRTLEKGDGNMLSLIEKVIMLKTVSIFADLPDDVLADIASGLDEVELYRQETLFHKGDIGDSMYIIVKGNVRVHDGDKNIALRGEREIIGEMALLDPQPSSASITAIEETKLLKLEQEVFYDLLVERIEVAKGVIKMLTHRLREAGNME